MSTEPSFANAGPTLERAGPAARRPGSSRSKVVGLVLAFAAAGAPVLAQPSQAPFEGYLCCNFFDDGSWINDINYRSDQHKLIPAGTPVKVTGYGRWRIQVEIAGRKTAIGNDYSRNIPLEEWAHRVVVPQDPTRALAGATPRVQKAVREARIVPGMTRAQVLLAIGWPPLSYNETLDGPLWSYWANRSSSYQVFWDEKGRVDKVFGAPEARALVVAP